MRYFVVNMRKGKYLSFLLYFYCYCDCYCCYLFFVMKVKSKKLAGGGVVDAVVLVVDVPGTI